METRAGRPITRLQNLLSRAELIERDAELSRRLLTAPCTR